MSLYVEWINLIKAQATSTWLTGSQKFAFEDIRDSWAKSEFVCVVGPPGSGKSFIARILAKDLGYAYVQNLADAPANTPNVVLDGPPYDRSMRITRQLLNLGRVVVIQNARPTDAMPVVELSLTTQDVRQARATLAQNGVLPAFNTPEQETDLARMLRNEAISRG